MYSTGSALSTSSGLLDLHTSALSLSSDSGDGEEQGEVVQRASAAAEGAATAGGSCSTGSNTGAPPAVAQGGVPPLLAKLRAARALAES